MAMCVCAANAWGQLNPSGPHIGYIYPAGGQRGSVFRIMVGGQHLRGVTDVYASGEGVQASVIKHYPPLRNLSREQREAIGNRLRELREQRWAELARDGRVRPRPRRRTPARGGQADPAAEQAEAVELPEHPLLIDLENKSLRELMHVRDVFFDRAKMQPNVQIAETVLIEVAVDSDAAPGNRELRLGGRAGLTNPMVFQVGCLPEALEKENNDPTDSDPLPKETPIKTPVVLNGQIAPGDIDRFRFRALRGQRLVIEMQARKLNPYLADAVPGWFQATLAVYDRQGQELAFADDYLFDPDPVLLFLVPQDGAYELEVRDAIYRGRQDFVYRIALGVRPFITHMFPLGGAEGHDTVATIGGWNLRTKRLKLNTEPGGECLRQTSLRRGKRVSNCVTYEVGVLPECDESEPNDAATDAQQIALPQVINGRIAPSGDIDTFQLEGRAGDELVVEVNGRRLHSALDSSLRLIDASGRVLEWNDDHRQGDGHLHKDLGLSTHHADSYLHARLPEDGDYLVQLTDSQTHGGEAYGYRLRMGPPMPDFELRVTPSSLNVSAGRAVPIHVYALREDGFGGEIELVLLDADSGFRLDGARIPAGRGSIRMTLTAPSRRLGEPISLRLEGRATINGQSVSRPVVPSEDMMQAFLYRHLVPSQELMVAVTGRRRPGPPLELVGADPVRIPAGGTARVQIRAPDNPRLRGIELKLVEPPAGIDLQNIAVVPGGLAFDVKADAEVAQLGFADNLIVEAFIDIARGEGDGNRAKRRQRVSLGVLPAIPIEIVRRPQPPRLKEQRTWGGGPDGHGAGLGRVDSASAQGGEGVSGRSRASPASVNGAGGRRR
ncbi:MAG: hypothetical protein ACYS1E_04950 [Planctomycetota bacterium]